MTKDDHKIGKYWWIWIHHLFLTLSLRLSPTKGAAEGGGRPEVVGCVRCLLRAI